MSSYDNYYDFENHIVILGNFSDIFLIDLLAEVMENDYIYS
jgi:hypothetical protein